MGRSGQAYRGKGGLELIEESMHALRVCPLSVLSLYYVGTLPFVLGFLFFWSEMSRSSYALDRAVGASLGMAVLFFWMKIWQSLFCRRILERWTPESQMVRLTKWGWFRYAVAQCFLQATSLPVQLLGANLLVPFAWVYGFYQNVTVLGFTQEFEAKPTRRLFRLAARQSNYLPRQNHLIIFAGSLFALFVWLNVYTVLIVLPFLLKRLLGIESVFTENPAAAILNTTFFAVSGSVAFLCISPLVKIAYTLRCFYGLSLTTGTDLLRRLDYLKARKRRAVALAAVIFFGAGWVTSANGAPTSSGYRFAQQLDGARASSAASANSGQELVERVDAGELEEAIESVISRSEYSWRMPRERPGQDGGGLLGEFLREKVEEIREFFKEIADFVDRVFLRLRRWILGQNLDTEETKGSELDWERAVWGMVYVLGALLLVVIVMLAVRAYRRRGRVVAEADDAGRMAAVDLESEEIVASELPGDEWLELAREQIERGEYRLAVRALFLASLASLGEKELVRIERSKSNMDYQRELGMRAREEASLLSAFADNVGIFERAWYGLHEVSREIVELFSENYRRIKAHGTKHGTTTTAG